MAKQATDRDKDDVNLNVVCRPGQTSFVHERKSTSLRSNKGGERLCSG